MSRWSKPSKWVSAAIEKTPERVARLKELVAKVRSGRDEVAAALTAIWSERLWAIEFETFDAFVSETFGFTARTARNMLTESRIARKLVEQLDVKMGRPAEKFAAGLPILTDRKSLPAIARLDEDDQQKAVGAVVEHAAGGNRVDHRFVKGVVQRLAGEKRQRVAVTKVESTADDLTSRLTALRDAAEVLAELAEAKSWTYARDQRLAATLQSLRIAGRKLRGMIG